MTNCDLAVPSGLVKIHIRVSDTLEQFLRVLLWSIVWVMSLEMILEKTLA